MLLLLPHVLLQFLLRGEALRSARIEHGQGSIRYRENRQNNFASEAIISALGTFTNDQNKSNSSTAYTYSGTASKPPAPRGASQSIRCVRQLRVAGREWLQQDRGLQLLVKKGSNLSDFLDQDGPNAVHPQTW